MPGAWDYDNQNPGQTPPLRGLPFLGLQQYWNIVFQAGTLFGTSPLASATEGGSIVESSGSGAPVAVSTTFNANYGTDSQWHQVDGTQPSWQVRLYNDALQVNHVAAASPDPVVWTQLASIDNAGKLTVVSLQTSLITASGATIAFNTKRLTGVVDPVGAQDAATKNYVDGAYTADEVTLHKTGSQFSIKTTYPGQASIVTLGTVTTGTWQGTAIDAAHGGTGQTSYTVGDIPYASAATVISKLAAGTAGQVLTANGAGVTPSYQALPAVVPPPESDAIITTSAGVFIYSLGFTLAAGVKLWAFLNGVTLYRTTDFTHTTTQITLAADPGVKSLYVRGFV